MTSKTRLIVGCGYVGGRIAQCWRSRGDRVVALTRTQDRAAFLRRNGLEAIVWDWYSDPSEGAPEFPDVDTVLIAVSHAAVPGIPPTETHRRGMGRLLDCLGPLATRARWIYLSTTGVFATTQDGSQVDEDSPLGPTRPGSIAALEGERWMESNITSAHRVVLRPAGIYGPDRVPRWESVRDSVPLQVDPDSFLNLIHVDDLVTVIAHVADRLTLSHLYCVCDGNSPRRREYYQAIADAKGWPPPIFDPGAQRQARSEGNKRVSPKRMLDELPIEFKYPSYREGLRALLEGVSS
jgi:nucleoside-diphosphate-sugar epimerase